MTDDKSPQGTEVLARIRQLVSPSALAVCRQLKSAGFEAWAVGGAVRDAILGRAIGDWDIATSAHPDEVIELFPKTIPTGLQHGTVTVMAGRGDEREAIEVTTFRGEGEYTDSRRPDAVVFGVPLDEDLARRDLVINAIAYDPIEQVLHDPFGGQKDIAARRIRAVGVAEERFLEDGLRVMRAVRFAAQLEFELDADTEAAIPRALSSLAMVSVERMRDELHKLLKAKRPSLGLVIAERTGVLGVVLPELHGTPDAQTVRNFARTLRRIDAASSTLVREAALLLDVESVAEAERIVRRLKVSNHERATIVRLVRHSRDWSASWTDAELRRALGNIGRDNIDGVFELWFADGAALDDGGALGDSRAAKAIARARAVLERGDALCIKEIDVKGADLIDALKLPPSRIIGTLLDALLERVLEDPALNQRDTLLAIARELARDLTDTST